MQRRSDFGQRKFRIPQQLPRKLEARLIEKLLQARPFGAKPLPQCPLAYAEEPRHVGGG